MCEFRCKVSLQRLNQNDVSQINKILNDGGLCILPSDSSYILTGLLSQRDVTKDIDFLLERQGMKMSLAFGSLKQANKIMDFSDMAIEFIRRFTPGGLTFVAKPKEGWLRHFSESRLHADGTIGMRLTESQVETQLAESYPLPSTPIRNSNHEEVYTAEEALRIVDGRMAGKGIHRKIVLVDGEVPYPGRLSTVVKEDFHNGVWQLRIIREQAIVFERIREVASACGYADTIID